MIKKKKIRIRFNLGAGKNHKKWKIDFPTNNGYDTKYLDPLTINLELTNCVLKVNSKIAKKIYNGANKSVCAYIFCDSILIKNSVKPNICLEKNEISFNPRINPHWIYRKKIVDEEFFESLITFKNKLYGYINS